MYNDELELGNEQMLETRHFALSHPETLVNDFLAKPFNVATDDGADPALDRVQPRGGCGD